MASKRRLFVLFLVCAVSASLTAQTSLTSATSGGNFETNTDKFLSVTDWSGVQNGLFYSGAASSTGVELGYGTSLGGLYLGTYYQGNLAGMSAAPLLTTSITTTDILANFVVAGKTVTTSSVFTANSAVTDTNSVGALVGFGNLGISLFVAKSTDTVEDRFQVDALHTTLSSGISSFGTIALANPAAGGTDTSTVTFAADGTTKTGNQDIRYTGGKTVLGTLTPTLKAAMVLPLGDLTLKPTVTLAFRLNSDSLAQSYSDVLQALGSAYPTKSGVTEVAKSTSVTMARNYGSSTIIGSAGLATDLKLGEVTTTIKATYEVTQDLYSNSYTDAQGVAATVAGTAVDLQGVTYQYTAVDTSEQVLRAALTTAYTSSLRQVATASAKFGTAFGPALKVATTAFASTSLENYVSRPTGTAVWTNTTTSNSDSSVVTVDKYTKTYNGTQADSTVIAFSPTLKTGLQYALLPNQLNLNLGLSWKLPGYSVKSTKLNGTGFDSVAHTTTVNGVKTVDTYSSSLGSALTETMTSNGRWTGMSSTVNAGLNLNLGEGVSFDLAFSGSTTINLSTVSLQLQISK